MKRNASAEWRGDLKTGAGKFSAESGALTNIPFSFKTRFETEPGSNPEELIAAAHAGCYSMALSNILATGGHTPTSVKTKATAHLGKVEGGMAITKMHLVVDAHVPGIDQATFDKAAADAKAGCPISRSLKADVTLETTLKS
jgi:osmotically inducible protein OsmC